jgi:hypothetical protein
MNGDRPPPPREGSLAWVGVGAGLLALAALAYVLMY